jgi:isopentenyl-diphosphate delta-isomerase
VSDSSHELLETFDEEGSALGLKPRSLVHAHGLWHRAVNVLVFRSDTSLLLQQRSAAKDVCPLKWDLSVAEHLKPGEDFDAAARRGLFEELGLDDLSVVAFGTELRHSVAPAGSAIRDREIQRLFLALTDQKPQPSPDEVADTRFTPVAELAGWRRESPDRYTPWFRAWLEVLEAAGWGSVLSSLGHPGPAVH